MSRLNRDRSPFFAEDIRDIAEIDAMIGSRKVRSRTAGAKKLAEFRGLEGDREVHAYVERIRRQAIRMKSEQQETAR